MKRNVLFLDDIRYPDSFLNFDNSPTEYLLSKARNINKDDSISLFIARNYDEFVSHISSFGLPDFISFDHDLGEKKDGYDCAKWLVQYCMNKDCDIPDYIVHSMNPVGKENIEKYLDCYHNSFYNT